jgi:hypothetical protein
MEGGKTSGTSLPDGSQTTNSSRTTYAGSSRSLACTTYTKKMGRSTISKISSAVCFFTAMKIRGLTFGKMCSNPCSRSRRIRRHTRSCTSFYSALSALIPSTTSRRPSVGTTGNSLTPNSGTIVSRHLIRTGLSYSLKGSTFLLTARRVYYMFANMASLNKWRRARGFSKSFFPQHWRFTN